MCKRAILKNWLAMSVFLLVMACISTGRTIYVDADATGANNGSSWADAYNYLQDALAVANSGYEIRVAEGIYKPDQGAGITQGDRHATFQLKSDVALYGGFVGCETSCDQRDWTTYETILSGDIGTPLDSSSYHVVTTSYIDATAILDGFTITAGNANAHPDDPDPNNKNGGGMLNNHSSPTVTNCTFSGNHTRFDGGGMYNWYSDPNVINCIFSGNEANTGGGMFNHKSSPTVTGCMFSRNSRNCGMFNFESSPTLVDCIFRENRRSGIANYLSSPALTNCKFNSNSTDNAGGGMYNYGSSPTLTNCIFRGNSANYFGGGMYNFDESSPTLVNCTFTENWAGIEGGGMNNWYSDPNVINCFFSGNSAIYSGGAMLNNHNSPTVKNCIFSGNSATKMGGAMLNAHSDPTVANCTFSGNSAYILGGAMINVQSSATVVNCILWNNRAPEGKQIALNVNSTIDFNYCNVKGGQTDIYDDGSGMVNWGNNLDIDPQFLDADNRDYHLMTSSPCIDAGYPNYIVEPNETDLDGNPRVLDGDKNYIPVIDIGAYEYRPSIPTEVSIKPDAINVTSKGKWITCYIWLSEDYNVADIDPNTVYLQREIQAELLRVYEEQQVAMARFSHSEVQSAINGLERGEVELTVSGELIDGTRFEKTDTIRIINKGKK
jgi:hypothetical protein